MGNKSDLGMKKEPSGFPAALSAVREQKSLAVQLCKADFADVFAFVGDNFLGIPTKNAGGLVLVQDDRRAVDIDLKGVALRDIQGTAELDG